MRIDLHTHSDVSDGTETPARVMAAARDGGLDVVALTDHDSTAGWDPAAAAVEGSGLTLVRGMELSARCAGVTVHLLSYLHDRTYQPLADLLGRIKGSRRERARAMVERLAKDYPIEWERVEARAPAGGGTPAGQGGAGEGGERDRGGIAIGRPHIADELVALGVVPDRSAAFTRLLHPRGPYYVRYWSVEAADAVELVRAAGGVPVFAHPGATGRQRIVGDDGIVQMADAGLAGLEVYHRDNPPEQRRRLEALAQRLGLLVTGSSDYHGAGKPNRLGENLTDEATLAAIVEQGVTPLVGGGAWAR
ncbi:MAG: PHP domain-containing protein [Bifidobacteriaceae bacterium]|jgi:predicted metal-dependent phosphoesterase TrpH|nr:PHP domain-containing protein [Bifidobacteriaceae bacterium]